MKDYAKEMMDMKTEFDALCKKYNHTGVAVVMEGKGEYFLSSVETDTNDEYIELITRGFDTLVGAMFTCYGNDKLKVARDRLGYALNKRYCQRLNMVTRTNPDIIKRKDNRTRGKILRDWQEKGIVLILGDDKQRYLGHWDYEKYGKPKQSKKVYFIPGEPETLPDGTVCDCPTALDILKYRELSEE